MRNVHPLIEFYGSTNLFNGVVFAFTFAGILEVHCVTIITPLIT